MASAWRYLPPVVFGILLFFTALYLSSSNPAVVSLNEEPEYQVGPNVGCSTRAGQPPVRTGRPTMASTWRVGSLRDGATIRLASQHSTWWGFDDVNNTSVLSCQSRRPATSLIVEKSGESSVRLRTTAGVYVTAGDDGTLRVEERTATSAGEFEIKEVAGGRGPLVQLLTSRGKFVTCTDHGSIEVYSDSPSTWESFSVVEVNEVEAWRGVNLGGWLILESWMTPDLAPEGTPRGLPKIHRTDSQPSTKPDDSLQLLQRHYRDFVTPSDFRYFSNHGINAVRIPVGWWLSEGGGSLKDWEGLQEHIEVLDRAFDMAATVHIGVFLALHAGPDQENGGNKKESMARMLDAVDWMAARYSGKHNFLGISLLSENIVNHIPMDILKEYYEKGYDVVRKHSPCAFVGISPRYRGLAGELKHFMGDSRYTNVILEIHSYLAFNPNFKDRPASESIDYVNRVKKAQIEDLQASGRMVLVGEWSLGFNGRPTLTDAEVQEFAKVQVKVYGEAEAGWFFWGHRMGRTGWPHWSFHESISNGWLRTSLEGW